MAILSMEPSPIKCWLVANLKIWAFIPMFIIIMIVGLIHNAFAVTPIETNMLLAYALVPAMAECILTAAQQTAKPMAGYALILCAPIGFMVLYHMGKFDSAAITVGQITWLWTSIVLSLSTAYTIALFAYKNSDEILSKLLIFRSSNIEVFESRMKLAFSCFVEAFIIIFLTLATILFFFPD